MSSAAPLALTAALCEGLACDYVTGVADQDSERLSRIFTAGALIQGQDEGRLIAVPVARWIAFVCAKERSGQGARGYKIRAVHSEGETAAIWLETRFGRFDYLDMLAICLTEEGPKIAGKLFSQSEAI